MLLMALQIEIALAKVKREVHPAVVKVSQRVQVKVMMKALALTKSSSMNACLKSLCPLIRWQLWRKLILYGSNNKWLFKSDYKKKGRRAWGLSKCVASHNSKLLKWNQKIWNEKV